MPYATWEKTVVFTQPISDGFTFSFGPLASSDNNDSLFAAGRTANRAIATAQLYTSISGSAFSATNSPTGGLLITGLATNSSGTKTFLVLRALDFNSSNILYSLNGTSWSSLTQPTLPSNITLFWRDVAVSSDGGIAVFTAVSSNTSSPTPEYSLGIWTTNNYGNSWTNQTVCSVSGIASGVVSVNNDVSTIFVATGVNLFISKNSGTSFTQVSGLAQINWRSLACSYDGQILLAAGQPSGSSYSVVYISTNGGTSFTQVTGLPTLLQVSYYLVAIASNSNGLRSLFVGGNNGIYISYDTGITWSNIVSVPTSTPIGGIVCNSLGNFLFYGCENSLYTATPTPTPTPTPIADICFVKNTPIETDQGTIVIQKIDPSVHTINNKKIITITKSVTEDKFLICFEKHALGENIPSTRTVVSKYHKIKNRKGNMMDAYKFLEYYEDVKKIEYDGDILYNILMEDHETVNVNNLVCETLHPDHEIAKLYKNNYSDEYTNTVVMFMNYSKKVSTFKKG
jgi:hypothetical protein